MPVNITEKNKQIILKNKNIYNNMNKIDLNTLSKEQLIELILKQNTKIPIQEVQEVKQIPIQEQIKPIKIPTDIITNEEEIKDEDKIIEIKPNIKINILNQIKNKSPVITFPNISLNLSTLRFHEMKIFKKNTSKY